MIKKIAQIETRSKIIQTEPIRDFIWRYPLIEMTIGNILIAEILLGGGDRIRTGT